MAHRGEHNVIGNVVVRGVVSMELIRFLDVCRLSGLSRHGLHIAVWRGRFPGPVWNTARAILWDRSEVEARMAVGISASDIDLSESEELGECSVDAWCRGRYDYACLDDGSRDEPPSAWETGNRLVCKMIDIDELCSQVSLSKTTIRSLIKTAGFPAPIKLTEKSVRWSQSEVDWWLRNKLSESRATSRARKNG